MDELRGAAAEAGEESGRPLTEPASRPTPRGWWQRLISVLGRTPAAPAPIVLPGSPSASVSRQSPPEGPPPSLSTGPESDLIAVAADALAADAATAARIAPAALQPRTPWAVRLDPARGSAD